MKVTCVCPPKATPSDQQKYVQTCLRESRDLPFLRGILEIQSLVPILRSYPIEKNVLTDYHQKRSQTSYLWGLLSSVTSYFSTTVPL